MAEEPMTLGEISRNIRRIETAMTDLTTEIRKVIAPVAVHAVEIESLKVDVKQLDMQVQDVSAKANKIAGAGAIGAVLAGLFSGFFTKH